jgi:protein-tyrosine kinase
VIQTILAALRRGDTQQRAPARSREPAACLADGMAGPRCLWGRRAQGPSARPDRPGLPPRLAEEFGQLRDRLLCSHAGQTLKTIAVCKATAGEGSSTVASQLARAFASVPRMRVVVVDSDCRHPGVHALLGVHQDKGLAEVLAEGATTTKERLQKTRWPNLYVLTNGAARSGQAILCAPHVFSEVLETLKAEFSVVLIDTPPTLAEETALAVAAQCDGVLLVVQAERTRWEVAQEAHARLRRAGAKVLGVVLNRRTYPIPEFLYKRL